jgi:tetratricopeptide (TPR) repeat protein
MKQGVILLLLMSHCVVFAQQENKYIQEGNSYYDQNDFNKAEQSYRQALEKNPEQEAAAYNLGNALYNQQKTDESLQQYEAIARATNDPGIRSKAWYNLGNALIDKKEYQKSVDAYKQALKANPADQDAKYNLAYAQAMLKRQQEQQDQDQEDNPDKKDEDQKKDQENQQDQQEKNDQQNQQDQQDQPADKNPDKKDGQQPQPSEKKFSPEELDRILQTMNKDDKDVQNKINQQKTSGVRVKSDKDW